MIFFSSFFGLPRSPIILFAAIYNHKNNKIKPLKSRWFHYTYVDGGGYYLYNMNVLLCSRL